jgi:hypothetical protein
VTEAANWTGESSELVPEDPPGEEPPGEEPPGDEPPGDEPPGDDPPGDAAERFSDTAR